MKKIITLFVLFFAFSFSASAQENKQDLVPTLAKKDTHALVKYLQLEGQITEDFNRLFIYKHKLLASDISKEKREALSITITKKIEATLSPDQFATLNKNPELLKQLTH